MRSPELFYAPVLVLAISDPLATLVGMTWKLQAVFPNNKTLQGSLVFLPSAFLAVFLTLLLVRGHFFARMVLVSLIVGSISSAVELPSPFGTDNLSVPLSVFLVIAGMEKPLPLS